MERSQWSTIKQCRKIKCLEVSWALWRVWSFSSLRPITQMVRLLIISIFGVLVLKSLCFLFSVMMQSYSRNRFAAFYFIIYVLIGKSNKQRAVKTRQFIQTFPILGIYCIMSLITAVIYNQFKGFFQVRCALIVKYGPSPQTHSSCFTFLGQHEL